MEDATMLQLNIIELQLSEKISYKKRKKEQERTNRRKLKVTYVKVMQNFSNLGGRYRARTYDPLIKSLKFETFC